MTLYELDHWEHNGYDDSDWYSVVYDSDADKLMRLDAGTTRAAAPPATGHNGCSYVYTMIGNKWEHVLPEKPTPEILVKARLALRSIILPMVELGEHDRVLLLRPDDVHIGLRVRFQKKHKCAAKEFDTEDCLKCNGTGHWANPRNPQDTRDCFACKGEGKHKKNFRKVKTADDKVVWVQIAEGMAGVVERVSTYGTFYRNGYNQPDGHNTTAIIKLDDSREVKSPLHKLRLDEEMLTKEELFVKADKLSQTMSFYTPFRTASLRL